jgi:hypothetical protein
MLRLAGLVAAATALAALATAAPASAWTASATNGTVTVTGTSTEHHNAVVEGFAGPATAASKQSDSVVITDRAATVTSVGAGCTGVVGGNEIRCATPSGVSQVTIDYTAGPGTGVDLYTGADDLIDVPAASAPFSLDAKTGLGYDRLTVYGPVGVSASMGDGGDYVLVSISGTTPLTPPGGTIDGGPSWDSLRLVDHRHETPICGADSDLMSSDPDENSADCETVEHPSLPN